MATNLAISHLAQRERMEEVANAEWGFCLRRFNVQLVFAPLNGKSLLSLPEWGPRLVVNSHLSIEEQREVIAAELNWIANNTNSAEALKRYRRQFEFFMSEVRAWGKGGPEPAFIQQQKHNPVVALAEVYGEL